MKYVMKGNPQSGKLDTPHLIVAQSYDCNYSCTGCNAISNGKSIEPQRMIKIADNWSYYAVANNNGKAIFHLKGGEPFMFEGVWDTINHAINKGLYLFITTNGSLIGHEEVKRLNDIYQHTDGQIIVSLDGSKEQINALSRPPGSYKSARGAIEKLVEADIPVAWNYRAHRANQHDLEDAIKLAEILGVEQFNVLYHTRIRSRNGDLQMPDFKTIFSQLEKVIQNGASQMLDWSLADMVKKLSVDGYECKGCTAGFEGFAYITPDGNVYACPNIVVEEYLLGTVEDSFKEIFGSRQAESLRNLHSGRMVCKGELEAYEEGSSEQKRLIENEILIKENIDNNFKKKKMALCFNRNW